MHSKQAWCHECSHFHLARSIREQEEWDEEHKALWRIFSISLFCFHFRYLVICFLLLVVCSLSFGCYKHFKLWDISHHRVTSIIGHINSFRRQWQLSKDQWLRSFNWRDSRTTSEDSRIIVHVDGIAIIHQNKLMPTQPKSSYPSSTFDCKPRNLITWIHTHKPLWFMTKWSWWSCLD